MVTSLLRRGVSPFLPCVCGLRWADSGAVLCGAAALCCVCALPPARAIVCMCTPPSYGYGYGSCGDVQ